MTPTDSAVVLRRPVRPAVASAMLLAFVLAVGFLVYQPGISGSFQLDDYSNLGPLEQLDADATPQTFLQFLVQGIASPLGRPLSLLSFMAQAQDWPDNPAGFIRINILLHLLNGALLYGWLVALARLRQEPEPARHSLPLAATALWLLAPIQVTSVLYVVQRMTELAATCVFLGLNVYLAGRRALADGAPRRGYSLMTLGMAIGAGLGTLAKENAAQMPLMVLALEFTLLRALARPRGWKLWAGPFLAAPAVLLLGYLAWAGLTASGYFGRDFTPGERLLTEPRVLFLYLHKILAPYPTGMRLWYDDFLASSGLFTPWTTAVALAGLAGVLAAAWTLRARAPLFAFAVSWFLACHLLESTTLSLELVFDHRNYQASVGPWLALAGAGAAVLRRASSRRARVVFALLIAAYLALQAAVTWQVATLWGRPHELTTWMARQLPDSRRAVQSVVGMLIREHLPYDAALVGAGASARWPETPAFELDTMTLSCQVADIPFPDPEGVLRKLHAVPGDVNAVLNSLDSVVSLLEGGHCPVGLPRPITSYTEAALANPALRPQGQNLLLLHSRALKLEGRNDEARAAFARAIDARPRMILLVQGVIDAVAARDFAQARAYLERARSDPRIRWRERWAYEADLPLLEQLVSEAEASAARP
jgi:protein O-mannosyl-transferase